MNGFTLITLRWYHGGVLDLPSGEPIYNGRKVTEFLDVDKDKMSFFELKDYIRELGYSTTCTFSIKAPNSGILVDVDNDKDILDMMCSLEDGDEVEVFVRHLVDEAIVGPMLIESGSHVDMGESGSAFNTRPSESENFNFRVGEDHLNSEDHVATFSTSLPFNTATADGANDDDIDIGLAGPDFSKEEVEGFDYSTEDSVESEAELVGDDDEEEYGSDVHEEIRELRAEKRSFQRRKRRERVAADNEEVPVGEVEPDLGFDETETSKVSHEGRLGGDEPYFASSDEDSFELDEDECCNDDEHESGRSRRILDYKDELLRTNPGTSCVVKIGEPDAEGKSIFQSVCKGQLFVDMARDGNNQMWLGMVTIRCCHLLGSVVEKENKHTWTMFVKCIRDDLGLGDGEGLTLITNMQMGMSVAITNVLPKCEHRMCARHILANWAKD
ncbi:hypothetical protein KY290_022038 [Solanum tuberosum]|uniref:Transposase MuDR plant domain-containing protein n=1 Tax=Solanum tuberosum TaxID=4113 RepID=A0ABQ7V6B6_SOLTU|nr:hypothetical protein KY289_021189 [Solanum tuberosum]KAH0758545.1 hypothetical protein KY290_022038 [Solanum tuberosum]